MKPSTNTILNGVLALIRGHVHVAREIFRAPNSGIEDLPATSAKIFEALDEVRNKSAATELIDVLKATMVMEAPAGVDAKSFLSGVVAVEQLINERIKVLGREYINHTLQSE